MRNFLRVAAMVIVLTACLPIETPTKPPIGPPTTQSTVSVRTALPSATLALATTAPPPATRLAVVDQASEFDASRGGWWSITTLKPVGQTFTPSFAGLDAVEVWTEDQWQPECTGTGVELRVNIRESNMAGPLVGSSSAVALPACFKGSTFFAFPSLLRLSPGKSYVIEVVSIRTDNWGVVWQQLPEPYPGGEAIVLGEAGNGDVWFREGLTNLLPVGRDYCEAGLWQHVRRTDGSGFKSQADCLQYVETGQ